MRSITLAAALLLAALAGGCATYEAAPLTHDTPGTQPGSGPFPSQVVGP